MGITPRRTAKRTLHASSSLPSTPEDAVAWGREVLEAEAAAIRQVTARLDGRFAEAVAWLQGCSGAVVVTAIGKPGFVAQKLSATLASTGVRSFYLHPAEAVHGDLGRVAAGDVVLALSNSGASEELVRLLPSFKRLGAKLIALTGDPQSALARGADLVLDVGRVEEACPMGLVPTASSAALHALSDALAMALTRARRFTQDEYAQFHPGGKLGRQVMRVRELMRTGEAVPVVKGSAPLSAGVAVMTRTPGRPGATLVVDGKGRMVGIFTDGDLRRHVEKGTPRFDLPMREVMGKNPRSLGPEQKVTAAVALMRETRVDQLPVVDEAGKPVGLLDVQDLLAAGFV
jgi:arabinose-5-phosphate isomerase